MRGIERSERSATQSSSPSFFKSFPLRVDVRMPCQTSWASDLEMTSSSALSLKTRLYGLVMFRLVDVQSSTVNLFSAGSTEAGAVVTLMSDDFLVPLRMVASAASIRAGSP